MRISLEDFVRPPLERILSMIKFTVASNSARPAHGSLEGVLHGKLQNSKC